MLHAGIGDGILGEVQLFQIRELRNLRRERRELVVLDVQPL